jgi:hypothetical protein
MSSDTACDRRFAVVRGVGVRQICIRVADDGVAHEDRRRQAGASQITRLERPERPYVVSDVRWPAFRRLFGGLLRAHRYEREVLAQQERRADGEDSDRHAPLGNEGNRGILSLLFRHAADVPRDLLLRGRHHTGA